MFRVGFGFVASVAKHETLIARPLIVDGLNDAAIDVSGLAGDELGDFAVLLGPGVHTNAVVNITDVRCGCAGDGDVIGGLDALCEFDFTSQHDVRAVLLTLHERLDGHLGLRVESEARINDGVGDGVTQFVRVAGRNRF